MTVIILDDVSRDSSIPDWLQPGDISPEEEAKKQARAEYFWNPSKYDVLDYPDYIFRVEARDIINLKLDPVYVKVREIYEDYEKGADKNDDRTTRLFEASGGYLRKMIDRTMKENEYSILKDFTEGKIPRNKMEEILLQHRDELHNYSIERSKLLSPYLV